MDKAYVREVRAAKAGDLQAFQRLVQRFQDQVTAVALYRTGEFETAREVAQEVFLESYLCLHQLTEDAAFPGWIKRIVVKRCDRVTRRKHRVITGEASSDPVSSEIDPAGLAQRDELAEQLRLAVSALPEPQRLVISLQYFADISGEEIADFLELPLTTVKKRLHDARRKLRDHGEQLMKQSIEDMKPSANARFSEETAFFIALRDRNLNEMQRLLDASPALANAEQNWSHDLAHQRVLPFPNKATALISAIELDDLEILDLLLASGADPDGRCGCATGEPALWAAALFNRPRHLERLLECGADPNVISAAGNTALHVAAMRGHDEVVSLLLAAGADPAITDEVVEGNPPLITAERAHAVRRTAADWARANGFAALAQQLAIETESASELECLDVDLRDGILETGIRAIDFFAPLGERSLTRLPFGAGVGMLVLLGELTLRFVASRGGAVVWTGFTQPPFDKQDFEAEMAEFGLSERIVGALESFKCSAEARRAVFESGIAAIEALSREGKQVLAVVLSTQGFEQDVEARRHQALRREVATILRDYVARDPSLDAFDAEGADRGEIAHCLLRYLSQPFRIATPFGGLPGEHTPLKVVLDDIEALLATTTR